MLMLSGYHRHDNEQLFNKERDILINSAGRFVLKTIPTFSTVREARPDFQLLYVASGKATFRWDGRSEHATAGDLALYCPEHSQNYQYHLRDSPDIYWIHITGKKSRALLAAAGMTHSGLWKIGTRNRYAESFLRIIHELQLKRPFYMDVASASFEELIFYFARALLHPSDTQNQQDLLTEQAMQQFNQAFEQEFSVEQYAKKIGVSVSWFIRTFRERTGETPLQYLTTVRVRRAQELLENTDLSISQIGEMVGYPDAFYFSRQFKKNVGISPRTYRSSKE